MTALLLGLKRWMTKALNLALIAAVALLVLSVCWGVFTRYALGAQASWTEELARFLLIWVTLLGGAVAFGTRGHLGVDFFVRKLHPAGGTVVAIFAQLVVLAFALSIFVVGGIQVVRDSLLMEQTTPALGWKMGHVYLALPIAGVFMAIYALENMVVIARTPAAQLHSLDGMEEDA